MRGLIPARIIAMMAERLREMGDMRPLYSHFDMIAGTSTGALIAAALAIPTEGTAFQKEEGREEEAASCYRKYNLRVKGAFSNSDKAMERESMELTEQEVLLKDYAVKFQNWYRARLLL